MTDDQPTPQFPNYSPPTKGIPVAHPKQASVLMKAIKVVGKISSRPKSRSRSGLKARDTVPIKHKKRFY